MTHQIKIKSKSNGNCRFLRGARWSRAAVGMTHQNKSKSKARARAKTRARAGEWRDAGRRRRMGSMGGELFLKKHGDYQRVYREGRKGSAALMGWFVAGRGGEAKNGGGEKLGESETARVRVGLTVPRTLGKAVDRNRMKRRMREAVRRQPEELLAGERDVVLHPRRTVLTCEFERLEREVGKVLREVAREGAGEKPRPRVEAKAREKVRARTKASSNG